MSNIKWLEKLGWNDDQLEDLRLTGYAYIRQGKYDIALPLFEALTVLDPNSAYDAQMLGAIYLELGKPAKALKAFDKALKLDTDHSPTLLNLTKALFMLGKKDEGLKLANILKNEPDPRISNAARALLLAYQE
ncbi:MAG: tetratricopeptide repeat protein [Chlamydiales bacterium]|nr:tetratricopeptide repeat protein [Chlamydiia bacterium]MCP5508519.1 tetratricopeptide repeat protein [Chlamydiales bacterium]